MFLGHDNAYYVFLRSSGYIETCIEGNLVELKVCWLTELV